MRRPVEERSLGGPEREAELPPSMTIRCEICDKAFKIWRANYLKGRRACSMECGRVRRSRNAYVDRRCVRCGEAFTISRARLGTDSRFKGLYCSRVCHRADQSDAAMDPDERKRLRVERQWERYQTDPEYRERRKRASLESHHRHKERRNAKRRKGASA